MIPRAGAESSQPHVGKLIVAVYQRRFRSRLDRANRSKSVNMLEPELLLSLL